MSATDRQREQLATQLGPIVADLGFDIDDITVTRVGRRHLVRVVIDGEDGIDLDAIAEASRAIDRSLDVADPFDSPFVLEVSSPGVDRPLTEPRHWRRNVGRLVQVDVAGQPVTARIDAVGDAGVRLRPFDGSPGARSARIDDQGPGPVETGWDELGPGRVQVEFNRSSEPAVQGAGD